MVGPAGVGKTRLATDAAVRIQQAASHTVWIVELGTLSSGASIADAVVGEIAAPGTQGSPEAVLGGLLGDRPGLLVLDNCEQRRADVAALVDRLIGTLPGLTVLATSRIPLSLDGEQIHRLAPLAIEHAVELFAARSGLAPGPDRPWWRSARPWTGCHWPWNWPPD